MQKILSISVSNLFNVYNHKIQLQEGGITIIYGLNGVGKTVILTMIHSFFNKNFSFFEKIPFKDFAIETTSGNIIVDKKDGYITCSYNENSVDIPFSDENIFKIAHRIEMHSPFLDQVDEDVWLDFAEREAISAVDVVMRYGDKEDKEKVRPQDRAWLNELIESINTSFIKTQRLENEKKALKIAPFRVEKKLPSNSAVFACAEKMKIILGDALADYARIAQQLDKTFPNRLLSKETPLLEGSELKLKMEYIENKRKELTEMNILPNTEGGESISYDTLEIDKRGENDRQVLSTYAEDSEKKLASLEEFSKKIKILLKNINAKFKNKKLSIDTENGLNLFDHTGTALNLSNLSSGEQHELILIFTLLFNTKQNSLILIDEPEISLHILWQKKFIEDLIDIIKINNIDVIVATHSPSIAEGYNDIMVGLDSPEA